MGGTVQDQPVGVSDEPNLELQDPLSRSGFGLVICAKTRRLCNTDVDAPPDLGEFPQLEAYIAQFPSSQDLGAAAEELESLPAWDGHEGPRARVTMAPGVIGVKRLDLARRERAGEREYARRVKTVEQLAAQYEREGSFPEPPTPRREITGWSRKSRANMVRALCEIDYGQMMSAARVPAMVTLTYPGEWLSVAPDGRAAKKHLDELYHRYRRAWGTDLVSVWKLEFQRRGAPHFHLLMVPPHGVAHSRADAAGSGLPFKSWLSAVWADVVSHPNPVEYFNHLKAGTGVDWREGMRASDPRRVSVYFTKHGAFRAKEYQNIVPMAWREPGSGPGRFWGYRYLQRAVHGVEVSERDAVVVARTLRRWSRAQGTTRQVQAPRVRGGRPVAATWDVVGLAGAQLLASRGRTGTRGVRRRVRRFANGAGWVSVNDGAAMAAQLARYLAQLRGPASGAVRLLAGGRVAYG